MELKIAEEKSCPPRREFRSSRSGRNQKAVTRNILEAVGEDGRMKIVVKKEDLKRVLEAIRDGRSWERMNSPAGAVSLEQRLNVMRRRQITRAASQVWGRSRGSWRPALQSIPEEL